MDVEEILRREGGAARSAVVLRSVTKHQLVRAVREGRVLSPAPGLFHLPGCARDVLAAAAVGGVLSCLRAARDHGLPVITDPAVHVTAPRGSRRTWPRTRVHRRAVEHDGHRTTLRQTVLDCLRCAPLHEAVGIGDHVLRLGSLTEADVAFLARDLHPSDPLRGRLALLDGRADSPPESWARVFLLVAGYSVKIQEELDGIGFVDLIIDGWLIVEIDGEEYHRRFGSFANDRRRDRAAYPQGCVVIRFPAVEVLRREYFLAQVAAVHAAGPPRG